MEIEKLNGILEKLSLHFSIERTDIFNSLLILLSDKNNIEWAGQLWDITITYEEAIELLKNFDFEVLKQIVDDGNNIIPANMVFQVKVRIKVKGKIWYIHKNDADPFPSSPHAHNIEQNFKLDLSNGNCYQRRTFKFKIGKKELLEIRGKAKEVYKGDLPPIYYESI